MIEHYVEKRAEGYWVSNSRISLESVIYAFLDGLSPETITAEYFPTLSLEQVYGAITYYLSHRQEIDLYLKQAQADFATFQEETYDQDFSRKMMQARREMNIA